LNEEIDLATLALFFVVGGISVNAAVVDPVQHDAVVRAASVRVGLRQRFQHVRLVALELSHDLVDVAIGLFAHVIVAVRGGHRKRRRQIERISLELLRFLVPVVECCGVLWSVVES